MACSYHLFSPRPTAWEEPSSLQSRPLRKAQLQKPQSGVHPSQGSVSFLELIVCLQNGWMVFKRHANQLRRMRFSDI